MRSSVETARLRKGPVLFLMGVLSLLVVPVLHAADTSTLTQGTTEKILKPHTVSEQNLRVTRVTERIIWLNGKAFHIAQSCATVGSDGVGMSPMELKVNDIVNIRYMTGGSYNEAYRYYPGDEVLISIRRIASGKK